MFKKIVLITVVLFLASPISCGDVGQKDEQPNDSLNLTEVIASSEWEIVEIVDRENQQTYTDLFGSTATFVDGGITMNLPCNHLGGFFEVDENGDLLDSRVHITLIGCSDSINLQEVGLIKHLNEATQVAIQDDTLIIQSLLGEVHFVKKS